MLIQRAGTGTLPPPGFMAPPWSSLAIQWAQQTPALAMHTTTLGPATVILGHDDSEAHDNSAESMKDVDGHEFGWDNESPQRSVEVSKFKIDWRPVSNAEFYIFWLGDGKELVNMPRSWTVEHDEIKVCFYAKFISRVLLISPRSVRSMDPFPWILQRIGQYSRRMMT